MCILKAAYLILFLACYFASGSTLSILIGILVTIILLDIGHVAVTYCLYPNDYSGDGHCRDFAICIVTERNRISRLCQMLIKLSLVL